MYWLIPWQKGVVISLIYSIVFLWDLFVLGLVLSGEDLIKITKSHMRSTCRKVKSQASYPESTVCQLANSQLGSPLEPVTSEPRVSPVLLKHMTFRILLTHTIYILITHRKYKEPIERKILREVSTTYPPYLRESYSFLERNHSSLFSFPLPLLYPLRRDLYPNTTHTHSKCW